MIDLDEIVLDIRSTNIKRGPRRPRAIMIFDLTDSTALKLKKGHLEGRTKALQHNLLCHKIIEGFDGQVIKNLGDGVLGVFGDGISACRAAIEIKRGIGKLGGLTTKAGLAFGHIEEVEIDHATDIYGDAVDRCARIAALAGPGQLLIDSVLYEGIRAALKDYPDLRVSNERRVLAKGLGRIEVYELSTKTWGLQSVPTLRKIEVHEEGRLTIAEKVVFMEGARAEIIELGVGLTTFTGYFTNRKPSEFRDPVITAMRRGVTVKCLALDPEWSGSDAYCKDSAEPNYANEIQATISRLHQIGTALASEAGRGSFELYLYSHFPHLHAVAVDPMDDRRGRLTVSHLLFGVPRSECPVLQFSKDSNPIMFRKYWHSISELLLDARRVFRCSSTSSDASA